MARNVEGPVCRLGDKTRQGCGPQPVEDKDLGDLHIYLVTSSSLGVTFALLAIFANVSNLIVFRLVRKKWNSHFHLVSSLTVADLLVSICGATCAVTQLAYGRSINDTYKCGLFLVLTYMVVGRASLLHVFVMAVEHYVALFEPTKFAVVFSVKRTRIAIGCLWVASLFLSLTGFPEPLLKYTSLPQNDTTEFCDVYIQGSRIEHFVSFAVSAAAILSVIILYVGILIKTKLRSRRCSLNKTVSPDVCTLRHRKLMKITFLVFCTFIVCWLPLYTVLGSITVSNRLLLDTDEVQTKSDTLLINKVFLYIMCMPMINCLCDAIIYGLRMRDVRIFYQRLLSKCRNGRPNPKRRLQSVSSETKT